MEYTTTTNGATIHKTSGKNCLDLFQRIGNMRYSDRLQILEDFGAAYDEDKELATQILFWARAARVGSGERKTFHTVLEEIGENKPEFISDNAMTIAQLGYWKDLVPYLHLDGVVAVFAQAIKDGDRLACKWAPRKCVPLRDKLGFTNKEYRKFLKKHSDTVEQKMSTQQWSDIKYSSVPGAALRRYSSSFDKRDGQRFVDWKNDKTTKASVSATYPHQVLACGDEVLAQKMWDNLPDLLVDSKETILPMIDTSGSMFGMPLTIALGLGVYLAQRNKSDFQDMFLSFSEEPELIKLQGSSISDIMSNVNGAHWGMNTDFEKAYRLILDRAVKYDVDKDSMPTMLLVLSDMQFDESQNSYGNSMKTHYSWMEEEFEKAGYKLPKIVFWNLDAHPGTQARCSDKNVAMVSEFSPSIMKAVLEAENFTPMDVMLEALKDINIDFSNLPDAFIFSTEKQGVI